MDKFIRTAKILLLVALPALIAGSTVYLKVTNDQLEKDVVRLETEKAHLDSVIESMEAEIARGKVTPLR